MARTPPKHLKSGQAAEDHALRYLTRHGLKLLTRNYRSPHGEIDLIMHERGTLVFVEVRYRRSTKFGLAAETVDARKQARLRATAEHYLLNIKGTSDQPCRFDVVTLGGNPVKGTVDWYPDAF
ncbi:MAG: YraN family protein [Acidiferrobacterales bacterium]|nr:YraN family protein [Acidiferrobacterales bacterium]